MSDLPPRSIRRISTLSQLRVALPAALPLAISNVGSGLHHSTGAGCSATLPSRLVPRDAQRAAIARHAYPSRDRIHPRQNRFTRPVCMWRTRWIRSQVSFSKSSACSRLPTCSLLEKPQQSGTERPDQHCRRFRVGRPVPHHELLKFDWVLEIYLKLWSLARALVRLDLSSLAIIVPANQSFRRATDGHCRPPFSRTSRSRAAPGEAQSRVRLRFELRRNKAVHEDYLRRRPGRSETRTEIR